MKRAEKVHLTVIISGIAIILGHPWLRLPGEVTPFPTQATRRLPARPDTARIPKGETITLKTRSGDVTVANFYKNAQEIIDDIVVLTDTEDYGIEYYAPGGAFTHGGFTIGLESHPLAAARRKAEKDFLARLRITEGEACKLSVTVGVPLSYNAKFAGRELGLSFCPGAIDLEPKRRESRSRP